MNSKGFKKPFFSIIVPTYNRADILKQAIQSVINQTDPSWELIIVDNFSSDDTKSVVNSFKDKRIKFFQINNKGIIAKSRNLGISHSLGDWIAFLDSDDYFFPQKLEICRRYTNKSQDIIYHPTWIQHSANKKIIDLTWTRDISKQPFINLLFEVPTFATSSVLVRKQLLDKDNLFPEKDSLVASEDFYLWLKLSSKGANFCNIRFILGVNQVGENNISDRDMSIPLGNVYRDFKDQVSEKDYLVFKMIVSSYHSLFLLNKGLIFQSLSSLFKVSISSKFRTNIFFVSRFLLSKLKSKVISKFMFFIFIKKFK